MLAFNHIGVSVPKLEEAIEWYRRILGFTLISGPVSTSSEEAQARDVLGPRFRKMRQAHMTTANGVGIELFELSDPPHERRADEIESWRSGVFHFCVTTDDVSGLARAIEASGGKQLSQVWAERDGKPGYFMCYCRDPFGCVIELYSHSYELMQGHRYEGHAGDPA